MAKKTDYTILIVCEGSSTEPNYFQGIKEHIAKENIWIDNVEITISPKPPLDDKDLEEQPTSKHKSKRKKRQLRVVENEPTPIIEEKYKAAPVRYVREAQQGLKDGTFDEVWAVFDKDGHPKPKEAYELSEQEVEEKKVNIAFTSIAFEHWVLLHFGKNNTAFLKSECKEGTGKSKKAIGCGTGISGDCFGAKCVIGYIKTCQYLDYGKSMNLFPQLRDNTQLALENAAWLRYQQLNNTLPIWEQNPYTDIDFLVKRLLQIDENITWTSYNEPLELDGIITTFSIKNRILKIEIQNNQKSSFIINTSKVRLEGGEKKNLPFSFPSKIIKKTDFVEIDLKPFGNQDITLSFDVSSQNTIMINL
jgi:hypothetical protein